MLEVDVTVRALFLRVVREVVVGGGVSLRDVWLPSLADCRSFNVSGRQVAGGNSLSPAVHDWLRVRTLLICLTVVEARKHRSFLTTTYAHQCSLVCYKWIRCGVAVVLE